MQPPLHVSQSASSAPATSSPSTPRTASAPPRAPAAATPDAPAPPTAAASRRAASVANTLLRAVDDRRHARRVQRLLHLPAPGRSCARARRRRPGAQRAGRRSTREPAASSRAMSPPVARHVLSRALALGPARRALPHVRIVARDDPDAQRRRDRRAVQPGPRSLGRPRRGGRRSLGMAERVPPKIASKAPSSPPVAAPVRAQRLPSVRDVARLEVGVHVGAAERVDRLLGIADQHQRGSVAGECGAHDRPLVGIGVLELVDQRDALARPQLHADLRAGGPSSVAAQSRDEVVEGHQRERPLAAVKLGAGRPGQPSAQLGRARRARRAPAARSGWRPPRRRPRAPPLVRTRAGCRGSP